MSSVRMCDRCGTIFSEAELGWQTYTGSELGEDGHVLRVAMDSCAECSVPLKQGRRQKPKVADAIDERQKKLDAATAAIEALAEPAPVR